MWIGGACLLLAAGPAAAQPVLDEIEVKAKKDARTQTLEVREVRESGAVDLGEALAEQGAASRVRRGAIANDVVLRWFQRDNVAVSIDGALVYGACPNRMDPPSFHVDYAEVDRVDVKKGPFDVSVPGGMGGTVSIDTRRPRLGLTAEANLAYASNRHGEGSGVLGYGTRWGDLLGGFAGKYATPYLTGAGTPITALYPVTSMNRYRDTSAAGTAYEMRTAWARAGTSFRGDKDRLQIAYAYQAADSVLYPYLLMDAVFDETHRLNASYRARSVGPFAEVSAQLSWSGVDHLMNDARRCSSAADPAGCAGSLGRKYSMETRAKSQVVGGKLGAAVPLFGEPLRLGADVYLRSWDAVTTRFNRPMSKYLDQASIPDVSTLDVGLHARYARRLGSAVKLGAGARLDVARSAVGITSLTGPEAEMVQMLYRNARGEGQPLSAMVALPSANLELDLRLAGPVTLYLGVGHAARVPDPQERFFALSGSPAMGPNPAKPGRIGNPSIAPPRNSEIDLGLEIATRRVLGRVQGFASNVNDAIVVSRIMGSDGVPSVTYDNVLARLAGAEITGRAALPLDLYLSAALTYTHGWNVTTGAALQETPPLRANVSLRWDIEWLFVEAAEVLAAPQDRVDASVGELRTPGYAVTNLRAGVSYRGFRLMGNVANLFDAEYLEHLNYLRDPFASGIRVPEPGRSFSVTLQYAHPQER